MSPKFIQNTSNAINIVLDIILREAQRLMYRFQWQQNVFFNSGITFLFLYKFLFGVKFTPVQIYVKNKNGCISFCMFLLQNKLRWQIWSQIWRLLVDR